MNAKKNTVLFFKSETLLPKLVTLRCWPASTRCPRHLQRLPQPLRPEHLRHRQDRALPRLRPLALPRLELARLRARARLRRRYARFEFPTKKIHSLKKP